MKIAVCDDMQQDCKAIAEYLLRYSKENMLNIEIEKFRSCEELLSAFSRYHFKIVFLDIYMGGISGVETAYKIRELDKDCAIIFITTSVDHRADGFEVGAVHYLVKPATYEGVRTALERCGRILAPEGKYFSILQNRNSVRVRMKDVIFAEVFGKEVLIHTANEKLKTYATLSKIAEYLTGDSFLMCHRCYIVNMRHITGVLDEDFVMDNGEKVPIRKNGRQKTKDEYSNYLFNSVRGVAE